MKATILKTEGDDDVKIVGSTGVAVAWIFHHYLKYYCNSHISWETSQLDNCQQFPVVNVTLEANDLFRYYQNVCTAGYSFVWWQWADWETHIDWMALNGINLPLAFSGQEWPVFKVQQTVNLCSLGRNLEKCVEQLQPH